jgi:carbamoyltransferase
MKILAIHDGHNASAVYLKNGQIITAIQEERLKRIKNYIGCPILSIKKIFENNQINFDDINYVVFAGNDFFNTNNQNFFQDNVLKSLSRTKNFFDTFRKIRQSFRINYRKKSRLVIDLKRCKELFLNFKNFDISKVSVLDHHLCHASSAWFGNITKNKRLIFTSDGGGDNCYSTVWIGNKDKVNKISSITTDESFYSPAQIYGFVTVIMGFKINEHEYKLMGMAPYGNNHRAKIIYKSFRALFCFKNGIWKYIADNKIGDEIFKIIKFNRFDDVCRALQMFFEKLIIEWILFWMNKKKIYNISCSGGAFMNVKLNLEIMKIKKLKSIFIFPSCGDETNSIGAAYYKYNEITNKTPFPIKDFYLGPNIENSDYDNFIKFIKKKNKYIVTESSNIFKEVAELIASGNIISLVWGREEFGARALGNRSIVADPRKITIVDEINNLIKSRDFWMPFASSILESDFDKYIVDLKKIDPKYMIMAFNGTKKVDSIPASIHPKDKSVRPQIVRLNENKSFYKLIKEFKKITGCGVVLNTSFNLHGLPLVSNLNDALFVLENSKLKYLVTEKHIILKK